MRLTTIPFFLLPAFVHSSTLSGWVPISTIYPTQTTGLTDSQPASITSQQYFPSPTSSMMIPGSDVSPKEILRSLALAGWVPIETIYPTKPPLDDSPSASLEGSESAQTPVSVAAGGSHLELRQQIAGVGGGAPVPVPAPVQVSPVTIININGVQIAYTQLFSAVPSQGPSASSGNIGLGTLTGSIGVVKTAAASKSGGERLQFGKNTLGLGVLGSAALITIFL